MELSLIDRLDRVQRRRPALGVPLAVFYKYLDDQGMYLAALIAFYGFFSLFPLFFLLTSVLGLLLQNDPGLQEAIIDSAAAQIPVIGYDIQRRSLGGGVVGIAVALGTALYGALGVATAVQNALNVTWNVRRNERPNPVVLRVKSVGLLALLGVFLTATTLLSQVGATLAALDQPLPWLPASLATAGSVVLTGWLFVAICRFGVAVPVRHREVLPGAVVAAVLWQLLQSGGGAFVRRYLSSGSATQGAFGVVLGLLAWLYLAAIGLVVCLELNVVLAKRLYPRALLTPMTDRVDLTAADVQAYTRLVRAQSLKGFQSVDVAFEHGGQVATATRRTRREAAAGGAGGEAPDRPDGDDGPPAQGT